MNVQSMNMQRRWRVGKTAAIIGYGTAAVNAAIALRSAGYRDEIVVFCDTKTPPYSPMRTSAYAAGSCDLSGVFPWDADDLESLHARVISGAPVTRLNTHEQTLTANGKEYSFDACLIATGSHPALPSFMHSAAKPAQAACSLPVAAQEHALASAFNGFAHLQPLFLRTLADAETLRDALCNSENKHAERVLISGTSLVALKALDVCLAHGVPATLLGRSEHIMSRTACKPVACALEEHLQQKGVLLRLGQTMISAQCAQSKKVRVRFSGGEEEEFSQVLFAHGIVPNLDFLANDVLGEQENRAEGLSVDEFMRTSAAHVYAAGDVARVLNATYDTHTVAGLWKEACVQGACAGYAMAADLLGKQPSKTHAYGGFVPSNSLTVGNAVVLSAGSITPSETGELDVFKRNSCLIACVYEQEKRLVGYSVFSETANPSVSLAYDEASALYRQVLEQTKIAQAKTAQKEIAQAKAVQTPAVPTGEASLPAATLLAHEHLYWQFMGQCTECGHCRETCSSLSCAGLNLGQIAKRMLAAERKATQAAPQEDMVVSEQALAQALASDTQLVQAVRGCFFCTSCEQACFAHNNVSALIYAARADFQRAGLIPREAWSSVLVDQEWHIFSAYRAIWGIGYADITRHLTSDYGAAQTDCNVAFFPGCSLAAYAPELTREVFATLQEIGGKATMIDHCCGSPLKSAGFSDRAEALCNTIVSEIESSGARVVVCVCPGCKNALVQAAKRTGALFDVCTVAEYLLQHNYTPQHNTSQRELCFSKSCQDRDGACLRATRELLGASSNQTTIFHGCCGAGGAVSAYNPSRQAAQINTKLSFARDGETVITMCPTCTYTYAYHLMSEPRPIENKHYLELLFEHGFDWEKVFNQLNSMWTGQYGPWLASVF